jgi:hypothetical protein
LLPWHGIGKMYFGKFRKTEKFKEKTRDLYFSFLRVTFATQFYI